MSQGKFVDTRFFLCSQRPTQHSALNQQIFRASFRRRGQQGKLLRFLIRCGKIIINNPADGVNKGYLLSPETGLLRTDEEKVVIEVETDLDTKKTTEEKDEEAQTKKRNSLLNYHLGPADIIRIQSSDLNGQFIIVRGTHKGSQSGDWKTEIEVRPA